MTPAAPAGFPRCHRCVYRLEGPPGVCLACAVPTAPGRPPPASCAACGQDRPSGGACTNHWCSRADRGWSVVWAIGVHDGHLRRVLTDYKYRGVTGWAPLLGRLVAGWLGRYACAVEDFDLLVPVPAFTGAGARRDWDPVGRIAAEAALVVGASWEVRAAVRKVAETPAMVGLTRPARRAAAEGPLRSALAVVDPDGVEGARVLVLDDVLTGGGTLREVARALRAAGAVEVAGLVLARPGWHGSRRGPSGAGPGTRRPGTP